MKNKPNFKTTLPPETNLLDWLSQFNPKSRIYYYALSAFDEGLCMSDIIEECKGFFNNFKLQDIFDAVTSAARMHRGLDLK